MFSYACEHGADASTVAFIVQLMVDGKIQPRLNVQRGLDLATRARNLPVVELLLATFADKRSVDYDTLLCTAIATGDEAFALAFTRLPPVATFLVGLESQTERIFIPPVSNQDGDCDSDATRLLYRLPCVAQAVARRMWQLVEAMALCYPTVVGRVMLLSKAPAWAKLGGCYARLHVNNQRIKEFYDAIEHGHVDVVRALLEYDPELRLARLTRGVSALMACSVSPNAVALMDCLHESDDNDFTEDALLYACANGGDEPTVTALWNWCSMANPRSRQITLWNALTLATKDQNLAVVRYLLSNAQRVSAMHVSALVADAIGSRHDGFALHVMPLPRMVQFYETLDALGCGWCANLMVDPGLDESDVRGTFQLSIVAPWVKDAFLLDMHRVAHFLDARWPSLTRRVIYVLLHEHPQRASRPWRDLSQRHVLDVTWQHVKAAHLVQRRALPGFEPLGRCIGAYLFVFDHESDKLASSLFCVGLVDDIASTL